MIGVIGAGRMGTALAYILSKTNNKTDVYLWGRRPELMRTIKKYRENLEYFPGIKLPNNLIPTADLRDLELCEILFIAVPSHAVRDVAKKINLTFRNLDEIIIVNTAKGLDYPPFKRLSQVLHEEIKNSTIAVLYGPTFADELVRNIPSGFTLASDNKNVIRVIKNILDNNQIIIETTSDVLGVEMCGILKNIYAIALGICAGIGVETNTYYLILTQAFKEMKTIIEKLGGKLETLFSYCGIGDLCLTGNSNKSRNRTLGLLYGKQLIDKVNKYESTVISEGKRSIVAIKNLCEQLNISCPLLNFTYTIVIGKSNPMKEFKYLWRQLKENDGGHHTFSRNG